MSDFDGKLTSDEKQLVELLKDIARCREASERMISKTVTIRRPSGDHVVMGGPAERPDVNVLGTRRG